MAGDTGKNADTNGIASSQSDSGHAKLHEAAYPHKSTLSASQLDNISKALNDALGQHAMGLPIAPYQPDVDKVIASLQQLTNSADREALTKAFNQKYAATHSELNLNSLITSRLSGSDRERVLAALKKSDFATTEINANLSDLHHSSHDQIAQEQLLTALTQMSASEIKNGQFATLLPKLLSDADLQVGTKEAAQIILGDPSHIGADSLTAANRVKLAQIALSQHSLDLLALATGGETNAATEAREKLEKNGVYRSAASFFDGAELNEAEDLLTQGHQSLITIARNDNANLLARNSDDLTQSLSHATTKERADYMAGRELALAKRAPTNDTEWQQLSYYNDLHAALSQFSSARQVAVWEDQLMRGGSLISNLGRTHSDGLGVGDIRLFGSHDTATLMHTLEDMPQTDWLKLKHDETFRRDLDSTIASFAKPEELSRLRAILQMKERASTYEEATSFGRDLGDVVTDAGTKPDRIISALLETSHAQQNSYRTDEHIRKSVNDKINSLLAPGSIEREMAQKLLNQMSTGQPVRLDGADRVRLDHLQGADASQIRTDFNRAVSADEGLARTLSHPATMQQRALRDQFASILSDAMPGYAPEAISGMLSDGYVSLLTMTGIHNSRPLSLQMVLDASAHEREQMRDPKSKDDMHLHDVAFKNLSATEKAFAKIFLDQHGKLSAADQARALVLGYAPDGKFDELKEQVMQNFAQLKNNPDRLRAIEKEYSDKYNGVLTPDLLPCFKDLSQHQLMSDNLRLGSVDPRETHAQLTRELAKSRSGLVYQMMANGLGDGTVNSVERALQDNAETLQAAARSHLHNLSEKQRTAMVESLAGAIQRMRDSKRALSEESVDAAITGGALLAAIPTGGGSLTALAIAASIGASGKTLGTRIMLGQDSANDARSIASDLVAGAIDGGLTNLGPAQLTKMAKMLAPAAKGAISRAASATADSPSMTFAEASEQRLQHELTTAANENIAQTLSDHSGVSSKTSSALAKVHGAGSQTGTGAAFRSGLKRVGQEALNNAAIGSAGTTLGSLAAAPSYYDLHRSAAENQSMLRSQLTNAAMGGAMGGALFGSLISLGKESYVLSAATRARSAQSPFTTAPLVRSSSDRPSVKLERITSSASAQAAPEPVSNTSTHNDSSLRQPVERADSINGHFLPGMRGQTALPPGRAEHSQSLNSSFADVSREAGGRMAHLSAGESTARTLDEIFEQALTDLRHRVTAISRGVPSALAGTHSSEEKVAGYNRVINRNDARAEELNAQYDAADAQTLEAIDEAADSEDPARLRQLAAHHSKLVRLTVSDNLATPEDARYQLSNDKDPEIRKNIARYTDDPLLLSKLANDTDEQVRSLVASNASTSRADLQKIGNTQNERKDVLLAVLHNPHTDLETVSKLSSGVEPTEIMRVIARNENTDAPTLHILSYEDDIPVISGIAGNSGTSAATLQRLASEGGVYHSYMDSLAANPRTPQSALIDLYNRFPGQRGILEGLCQNLSTPDDLIAEIKNRNPGRFREELQLRTNRTAASSVWT